jgi:hypothetical protein
MTGDRKITAACRKNPKAATTKQASAPYSPPTSAPMAAPNGSVSQTVDGRHAPEQILRRYSLAHPRLFLAYHTIGNLA